MREVSRNTTDLGRGRKVEVVVYDDGTTHVVGTTKLIHDLGYIHSTNGMAVINDQSQPAGIMQIVTERCPNGEMHVTALCDDQYPRDLRPQLVIGTQYKEGGSFEKEFAVAAEVGGDKRYVLFSAPYPKRETKAT